MERRSDEESRRLRTLEENLLDVEGDVEVNLNTTAYLENKMLVMERDGERDQFERQASCVYANEIQFKDYSDFFPTTITIVTA